MSGNSNVLDQICNAVINLEVKEGHLRWKVSDIARMCKVSRPLIYYHFGKTKPEILLSCFKKTANEFYGLSDERRLLINALGWKESIRETRAMYARNPNYAAFYQKWRVTPSYLQDAYLKIEADYQKKLHERLPHASADEIKALHAFLHGIVTTPFLTDSSFEVALSMFETLLRAKKIGTIGA